MQRAQKLFTDLEVMDFDDEEDSYVQFTREFEESQCGLTEQVENFGKWIKITLC